MLKHGVGIYNNKTDFKTNGIKIINFSIRREIFSRIIMTGNGNGNSFFKRKIKEIHQFLYSDLLTLNRQNNVLIRLARFIVIITKVFVFKHCLRQSAALAFATFLAIFPLVAVMFFLVPIFIDDTENQQKVQQIMMSFLVPGKQNQTETPAGSDSADLSKESVNKAKADAIENNLEEYFKNYRVEVRKLKAIGIIGTIIVAIVLFITVEQSFSLIWGIRKRPFIRSFILFSGIIIWIPLLVGLSLYFSAEVAARVQMVGKKISLLLPLVLSFTALVFAFCFIPNTKVNIWWAMIGAGVSALLWEVAKLFFNNFIFTSMNYSRLINSVGATPYLLIWLYTSWLFIMLGVVISYCGQNLKTLLYEDVSQSFKLTNPAIILIILFVLADRLEKGLKGASLDTLRGFCPVADKELSFHVNFLAEQNIVQMLAEEDIYILVKPADKIFLKEFISLAPAMEKIFIYEKEGKKKLADFLHKTDICLSEFLKTKAVKDIIIHTK